jgi:O-antigen/teichoic acid export membrane protein
LDIWLETKDFARWTIGDFLSESVNGYGMAVLIAGMVGPVGAGVFAATRNVVAPVYTVISAVGISDLPRMVRAYSSGGAEGIKKSMRGSHLFTLSLGLPFLAGVFLLSGWILGLLYGAEYVEYETELRLWTVISVLLMLIRPLDMWLLATLHSRILFWAKLSGSAVTLLLACVVLPSHGVSGALAAVAVGMLLSLGSLIWVVRQKGTL